MANPYYYKNTGPNYDPAQDLLTAATNSPFYQQPLAEATTQIGNLGTDRTAGIQQLLTQFGELPPGFVDKYGDINDTTKAAINANTQAGTSIFARLQQARQDAQTQMLRGLAAQGLRRSGARGFQLRKQQLTYDQAHKDAIDKLLGGASSLYSNYANNVYGVQKGLEGSLQSAINNISPFWSPSPTQNLGTYSQVGMPGTSAAINGLPHVGGPVDESGYM